MVLGESSIGLNGLNGLNGLSGSSVSTLLGSSTFELSNSRTLELLSSFSYYPGRIYHLFVSYEKEEPPRLVFRYVHIPKPCHEDWGRYVLRLSKDVFCSQCKKEVVDLTDQDETRLAEAWEKSGGQFCGRIMVFPPVVKVAKQLRLPSRIALSALALLGSKTSFATDTQTQALPLPPSNFHIDISTTFTSNQVTLIGRVQEETGEACEHAVISIWLGDRMINHTFSDENGHFEIVVSARPEAHFSLKVRHIKRSFDIEKLPFKSQNILIALPVFSYDEEIEIVAEKPETEMKGCQIITGSVAIDPSFREKKVELIQKPTKSLEMRIVKKGDGNEKQ